MYFHGTLLIYSKVLRIIQDDNIRIIKKNSLGTTKGDRYTFPLKVPDAVGIIKQPFGCFMFLYTSVLAFKGMIHLLLITCLNKLIKHESLGRHLYIQYITQIGRAHV